MCGVLRRGSCVDVDVCRRHGARGLRRLAAGPDPTGRTAAGCDGSAWPAGLFAENGCGACHTIRGTEAAGIVGPDLTHVGSRHSLAAATLPNDVAAFARWITDNQHIKPANLMPPYGMFSDSELAAVSNYLASLR